MADIIQLRRDTAANWTSADPTLAQGELGIETDTLKIKIGDGVTEWTSLPYYETPSTAGTVESVALSVPTGLEVSGSPVTTTGTITISFSTGYSIPTTTKQGEWDTAYSWGNHASAGYLTSESDPIFAASDVYGVTSADISSWDTAYSWGNHASAGYLDSGDIGVTVLAYDSNLASFVSTFTLPTADSTANYVLATDGAGNLSFIAQSGGMANPMTTLGDVIVGGASGSPSRLPVGAEGQVLTVVSGEPEWANSASGFSNPMTTLGDLIVGDTGGAAKRLAAGSEGQVLTLSSGEPSWTTPSGGDSTPVGGYVFVQTNLTGAEEPDPANYIKLTAGLTGSGQYNEGKLTSESVTGSAPLVVATAVIDDAASPMDGQTVHLLNTENRYIMPGTSAGTVANDQMQTLTGTLSMGNGMRLSGSSGVFSLSNATDTAIGAGGNSGYRTASFDSANSSGARTGNHTNVKRIQVTAYMRIK
jgi:hypothetical protein